MKYSKPVTEIIRERKSVRTYDKIRPVEDDKISELVELMKASSSENFRFQHVQRESAGNKKEKLGTYGSISGADNFILGIVCGDVEDKKKTAIEFGSSLEKIILKATDLGLGTCWMISSFSSKNFSDKIQLSGSEFISIVSPLGYAAGKKRTMEKIMRKIPKSDQRKPWGELFFSEEEFTPLREEEAGDYKTALEMLRLAPSAVNYQPWRAVKQNNGFGFYICRDKIFKKSKIPCEYIDLGIGMCHFELTLNEAGIYGEWYKDEIQEDIQGKNFEYALSWKNRR